MKHFLTPALQAASRLTRSGRLSDMTETLQRFMNIPGGPGAALELKLPEVPMPALPWPGGRRHAPPPPPAGAQFLRRVIAAAGGERPYKLYVPSGYKARRRAPLIVMLHGCTQSADDFAAGTRMNEAAEARDLLVAYPEQISAANLQKCWNWFNPADQQRGGGEPALIAGMIQAIRDDYAVDPSRIYIAGLSAGGAAAAIMGRAYPDLFAAVGVHSGLACGAARDMQSAFMAMQRGHQGDAAAPGRHMPTIIFHGESDATVNPRNADAVAAQAAGQEGLHVHAEQGHGYTRVLYRTERGQTVVEQWRLAGAPHAWSGGSAAGSFTYPNGPDATTEMLRFFLENRAQAART